MLDSVRIGEPRLSGRQHLKKSDIIYFKAHHIPGLLGHSGSFFISYSLIAAQLTSCNERVNKPSSINLNQSGGRRGGD